MPRSSMMVQNKDFRVNCQPCREVLRKLFEGEYPQLASQQMWFIETRDLRDPDLFKKGTVDIRHMGTHPDMLREAYMDH